MENARLVGTSLIQSFPKYLYFSHVMPITLGYGGIAPATIIAPNWAVLEAIVGQFYLAIIVARLVYTNHQKIFLLIFCSLTVF